MSDSTNYTTAREAADRLRLATVGEPLLILPNGKRRLAVFNNQCEAGWLSLVVQANDGPEGWRNSLFVNVSPSQLVRLACLLAEVIDPGGRGDR